MADAAAVGVREPAAIEVLRGEARRVEAAQRHLRVRRVAEAHRRDSAVAPGLTDEPGAGVEAVRRLAQILGETALRAITPAAILVGDGIARLDEIARHRLARARRWIVGGDLRAARRRFIVGSALENHRKAPVAVRPVDIGRQPRPVARGDHDVAPNNHVEIVIMAGFRRSSGALPCPSWAFRLILALVSPSAVATGA